VRQLINIGDLASFQKFIQLCAARIGNLLNLSDLATVCGISVPTARRWLSVLEASYIIFLLEPHHNNFNKRLTKMPKLYFYDTGLACNLLRIASAQDLIINQQWGSLFECFIMADLAKQYFNQGQRPPLYFWRDKNGRLEVDCLVDRGNTLLPIEIKASEVVVSDFFRNLNEWNELAYGTDHKKDAIKSFLIYAGTQTQERASGKAIGWKDSGTFIDLISGTKTKRTKPLSRAKK
jgi:predicted AAA+ superfamily ATPase